MELVKNILINKYGINIKNDYINGAEFVIQFEIDDDIDTEESSLVTNDGTYITYNYCEKLIIKNNIEEFLILINKLFKCEKCNEIFKSKRNLNHHMQKLVPCEPLFCKVCNFQCKNKSTLKSHKKTKKHITNITKNSHSNNTNCNNTNCNSNNISNTNSNNIFNVDKMTCLLFFNDPKNGEKLSEKEAAKIMSAPLDKMISNLIALTHFNTNYPESQNIKCINKQSKNVFVYQFDKWNTEKIRTVANDLLKIHGEKLRALLEKHKNGLKEEKIQEIRKYIDSISLMPKLELGMNLLDYNEACREFFRKERSIVNKIIDVLYDETQRMKMKNPLK